MLIRRYDVILLKHNRTHSDRERGFSLFYNPRMGNRLFERIRRIGQPYPQPGHPGDFSQQDGDRNSQPRHPGDFLQQDENRNEGTCLSTVLSSTVVDEMLIFHIPVYTFLSHPSTFYVFSVVTKLEVHMMLSVGCYSLFGGEGSP